MFFKNRDSEKESHRESVDEIDRFFEDDDKPIAYPKLALFIALGTIASLAAHISLHLSVPTDPSPDFKLFGLDRDWITRIAGVLEFTAVSFIALAASLVAIELINRRNLNKIRLIKNLTQRGAMKAVLKGLNGYNHKYTLSKSIELVFEKLKVAESGFEAIKCTQTIRQRMPLRRKELILDFIMLDRESGKKGDDFVVVDLQNDAVPDDAHTVDITDIRMNFPAEYKKMFPGVVEVIVDSQPCTVNAEQVNGRENHLRWRIDTRKHLGIGLIDVMYRYCYYYEATGFAFFEASEPTRGFFCGLNYHGVAEDISVYSISNLNSRVFGLDVGEARREESHRLEVSTSDWIIPRSMVVFCWYARSARRPEANEQGPAAGRKSQVPAVGSAAGPTGASSSTDDSLDVNGNCLGVALLDAFTALDVEAPQIDYSILATSRDALAALRRGGSLDVSLLLRSPAKWIERTLLSLQAVRLGIKAVRQSRLENGDVVLCMRSMRQLYGLPQSDAHWVLVRPKGQKVELIDKLKECVVTSFPNATPTAAEEVLAQTGPTFRISLK